MFWFTSDTHFGHKKVIGFCSRPFPNVEIMDEILIKNWNEKVGPSDTVYHLGDFALNCEAEKIASILRRLNGKKTLIYGNHDNVIRKNLFLREMFVDVLEMLEIRVLKQNIVLCHFPMIVWHGSHRGTWMLHGHCHGTLKYPYKAKIMDVGTDPNGFFPVSFEDIQKRMEYIVPDQVDVHVVDM